MTLILKEQFNFIASTEPELEDDTYELRAYNAYYIQDATEYMKRYIAYTPRGQKLFINLEDAMTYLIIDALGD